MNAKMLNLSSAALSREFFVAIRNTERECEYLRHLGTNATLISEGELEMLIEQLPSSLIE
jgi:hypothetical protein